jgi:peptide-methionine (S)-S-oxide reductase
MRILSYFVAVVSIVFIMIAGCSACKTSNAETMNLTTDRETIVLGGGCFWCIEAIFANLKGVDSAVSGYSNGKTKNPTYKEVCTGTTGHAEVVKVTYDPKVISLKEILEVFFTIHDPTTLNRQGGDVGTQYRSGIYFNSPEQQQIANEVIADLVKKDVWQAPIVTEVVAADAFYPAEDYHQQYFELNGTQPYCQIVIQPKVKKFKEYFKDKLKQ